MKKKEKKMKLYGGKNCPCPYECDKHGKCKECTTYHHDKEMKTRCETLLIESGKYDNVPVDKRPFYYDYKP